MSKRLSPQISCVFVSSDLQTGGIWLDEWVGSRHGLLHTATRMRNLVELAGDFSY